MSCPGAVPRALRPDEPLSSANGSRSRAKARIADLDRLGVVGAAVERGERRAAHDGGELGVVDVDRDHAGAEGACDLHAAADAAGADDDREVLGVTPARLTARYGVSAHGDDNETSASVSLRKRTRPSTAHRPRPGTMM